MTLVRWTKGYNQAELASAQHRFGLVFPPDLVALLREKRPVEGHDWTDDAAIRQALDRPFNGLLDLSREARRGGPNGERDLPARTLVSKFCGARSLSHLN